MTMRLRAIGIASAVVLAGGVLTVTGSVQHAFAACPNGLPAQVYEGGSQIGATGATAVGVCVMTGTAANGGHLEAGTNGSQAYVIAQGSGNSIAPNGADNGYAGLSDYETGSKGTGPQDAPCPSTAGSGTNSGGSVGVKTTCGLGIPVISPILDAGLPVPLVACGNASGQTWSSTTRDGCWVP
jgi:hypothetical protein